MQNISVYHLGLWDTDPLVLHDRLQISNLKECNTLTVGQPAVKADTWGSFNLLGRLLLSGMWCCLNTEDSILHVPSHKNFVS